MTTYLRTPEGAVFTTEHPEYHKECHRFTQKEGKEAHKEYAREQLREILKPGQTVYTQMHSVSSSGMTRRISVLVGTANDGSKGFGIRNLDYLVAVATNNKSSDKGGIIMTGCGMDMGFALVYELGSALWPSGTPKPHGNRNGAPDSAGGYALKHSWI